MYILGITVAKKNNSCIFMVVRAANSEVLDFSEEISHTVYNYAYK